MIVLCISVVIIYDVIVIMYVAKLILYITKVIMYTTTMLLYIATIFPCTITMHWYNLFGHFALNQKKSDFFGM